MRRNHSQCAQLQLQIEILGIILLLLARGIDRQTFVIGTKFVIV